jgi:Flp pilus assembly protein TadG
MHIDDVGATIVEFALAVPILIVVVICCVDFARALNAYVLATNASRDGARYVTMHMAAPTESLKAYVVGRAAPLSIDPSAVTISVGTPEPSWAPSAPKPVSVTVTITYTWQSVTWIAGSFISATGSRAFLVSSTMEAMQ